MRAGESAAPNAAKSTPMGTAVSLPLYAGGLAVTLCGVQAVCASMTVTEITFVATLMTVLGFAFSLFCRHFQVAPRIIEVACGALIAYILYQLIERQSVFGLDLQWYLQGADKNEDRLAAGLMWSAVLWSWTLVSSESVMFSCVLTAAMIGLTGSVNVNNSTLIWFCLFVLAMTFLLIHQNYLQNRALSVSSRPVPVRNALRAQAALAGTCAVLVLCCGLVLVVPLRAVLSSLSLGQAIRQLVGSSHISGEGPPLSGERFSDTTGLEIGRGSVWPTSSAVLMVISPTDNQPHYWRGRTYDLYTGKGWLSTQQNPLPLEFQQENYDGRVYMIPTQAIIGEGERPSRIEPRRPHMTATVDVRGDTEQFYYADEPRILQVDTEGGVGPSLASDGSLDLSGRTVRGTYTISSATPSDVSLPMVQEQLRRAGTHYPFVIRHLYLGPIRTAQNTTTTKADLAFYRQAVHEALATLPPDHRTQIDQALALRDWVSRQCTYSLSVDPLPAGVDHVHYFLTKSRRGYCDMFASAMVVLARTAGLPARLATGFAPGEPDETGTAYDIRAMDKHAWVEVYFPGSGWLIFDPTIGSSTDGSIPTADTSVGLWPRLLHLFQDNGPLPLALLGAITLCLGYVGKTELYDRRWAARRPDEAAPAQAPAIKARTELGRQYARMTQALGRLGLPRRAAETPDEYEARVLPWLAQQEKSLGVSLPGEAVSALTTQFVAARYGGALNSDLHQAQQMANQFTAAATRARWVQWWRQGRARRVLPP